MAYNGTWFYKELRKIPKERWDRLQHTIKDLCLKRGFTYQDKDGSTRLITLMLAPRLLTRAQREAAWKVCQAFNQAYERVPEIFLEDAEVRKIFPFEEPEKKWVYDALRATKGKPHPIFSRWDANTRFSGKDWLHEFRFFENNGGCVGGIWYSQIIAEILVETAVSEIMKSHPSFHLMKGDDARILLLRFLTRHARLFKIRSPRVALAIDRDCLENAIEFPMLSRFFKTKGLEAIVCDPRDLALRNGGLSVGSKHCDLVFRDNTIKELIDMEAKGANLTAFYEAFKQNRVISSMAGEFDHKSLLELFTNPLFEKHFPPKQHGLLRKHALWTRMIQEVRTENEKGRPVDLVPYIRKQKNQLVLKPNRLFGGQGVLIGRTTSQKEWDVALGSGICQPGSMVVQAYGDVYLESFPYISKEGKLTLDRFYVVTGFIATPEGLGVLGRVSKRKVVNVARHGGMSAFLLKT